MGGGCEGVEGASWEVVKLLLVVVAGGEVGGGEEMCIDAMCSSSEGVGWRPAREVSVMSLSLAASMSEKSSSECVSV